MSKPRAKKKVVFDDNMTEEEMLIECIKAEAPDEVEKLFEQYPTLDVNFGIYEDDIKDMNPNSAKKKSDTESEKNETDQIVDTPFSFAVRMKCIPIVEILVKHRADFNDRKIRNEEGCLHIAVHNDDLDMLRALLKIEIVHPTKKDIRKIVERDARNAQGKTAVLLAIEEYKPKLVEVLVEHGAQHDFNARNENDRTLMLEAAFNGDIRMITCLMELGQSPFQKDYKTGMTILHLASLGNKKDVFEFFLKKKVEPSFVNAEDLKGNTVLTIACDSGNWELCKLLISKLGAELHQISSKDGFTLIHRAAFNNNKDMIDKILGLKAKITATDKYGNTPLHIAASVGALDAAKYLIDKKCDIKLQNNLGNTAFHHAAYMGHLDILTLLLEKLEKKANAQFDNKNKRNPLHEAASRGHIDTIKPLLSKAIDVNAEDINEMTALQIAISEKQIEFARALIQNGAKVEREYKGYVRDIESPMFDFNYVTNANEDSAGYVTILQQAVCNGYDELVGEMIRAGASVTTPDVKGYTPLHNAVLRDKLDTVKVLTSHGANVNAQELVDGYSPLMIAVQRSNEDICKHLIVDSHASPHLTDQREKTALHFAAKQSEVTILKLLIDAGANVNHADKFGRTPVFESAEKNSVQMTDVLLDNGADMMHRDLHGETPLHIAAMSGSAECTLLLIQRGAVMNVKNDSGMIPLVVASHAGQTECGRLLIKAWNEFQKTGKIDTKLTLAQFR
jgi:ankyrin repeat protein